ncbi:MAG: hypothetical protein ACK6EB_27120, partial [Planctomyces sp.]
MSGQQNSGNASSRIRSYKHMLAGIAGTRISWSFMALSLALMGHAAMAGDESVSGTPSRALPRSSPESQGISSEKLRAFVEAANRDVNT